MPVPLQSLLYQYEGWLLERVLQYARQYGYARYAATLEEGVQTFDVALSEAYFRGDAFDAVILDLTIPGGIGGKELIGLLREIDSH